MKGMGRDETIRDSRGYFKIKYEHNRPSLRMKKQQQQQKKKTTTTTTTTSKQTSMHHSLAPLLSLTSTGVQAISSRT
jgi:hypothetical protein